MLTTADPAVAQTLQALGATGKAADHPLDRRDPEPCQAVEKSAPTVARAGVELSAKGGRLTVAAEGQSITLAEPDLQVELLFRNPATWSASLAGMPQDLRIACSGALPVPLPDYGMNYV